MMRYLKLGRSVAVLALLAASCGAGLALQAAGRPAPAAGAWAEHVQVIYKAADRSVSRQSVKVWDAQPQLNLEFTWEPDAGQDTRTGPSGGISGLGRLTWRVKGSPSYDPKTVFSVYHGMLVDGRAEGRGRLEIRSGAVLEGAWANGVMSGIGFRVDASGDRYEGEFVDGEPQGQGVLRLSSGEIYSGAFQHGLRHGKGRTRLAGGTTYMSEWTMGREIGGKRPDVLADAMSGGLIKAGTAGGAADKVSLSVSVDQRMTQQADVKYQQLVRDQDVAVFPAEQEMNDAWNGARKIDYSDFIFNGVDWENAPAFMEVDLATSDGSRVKLDKLGLDVASSETYEKPMLSIVGHLGCVGFRPSFTLNNNGWGQVKGAKLAMSFSSYDNPDVKGREFQTDIGNFDNGTDVSVRDVLAQAGVDVDALETQRFSCPSIEGIAVCKAKTLNAVNFGEIRDFVSGDNKLSTTATGTISYTWSDDNGNDYQASEAFSVDIALATIETPAGAAECGDGSNVAPEALRYQDVHLQLGAQNYAVPLEVRGNKNFKSFTGRLKVHADKTSFHSFSAVASFADGSERHSKPISLYYFRPRPTSFTSTATPPACYLTAEASC